MIPGPGQQIDGSIFNQYFHEEKRELSWHGFNCHSNCLTDQKIISQSSKHTTRFKMKFNICPNKGKKRIQPFSLGPYSYFGQPRRNSYFAQSHSRIELILLCAEHVYEISYTDINNFSFQHLGMPRQQEMTTLQDLWVAFIVWYST